MDRHKKVEDSVLWSQNYPMFYFNNLYFCLAAYAFCSDQPILLYFAIFHAAHLVSKVDISDGQY